MKRILLFVITNIAIMAMISLVLGLLGISGILDAQGVNLDYSALLISSVVIGFSGSLISLVMSKWSAKRMMGLQIIENPRSESEIWLVNTVTRLAKEAGIGMPEVASYEAPEMNAFATGMSRNSALVAVSTGLLRSMDRKQVEAVLAHEISHVANGDMVTLALMQGVVNTFVIFFSKIIGHLVDRVVFKTTRGHGPAYLITSILAQIVLGVLATMIVMWFSRHREFRADEGGAKLTTPQQMASALDRLRQAHAPSPLPEQLAAFGISGGLGGGLKALFMSHPPIEERIRRLIG